MVPISNATDDLARALQHLELAAMLGWQDVKQRYRRSYIGPFWLTISMGVLIASIGLVFGQIFRAPVTEYLPFLAAGLILWAFISAVINEGCTGFIDAEGIIKQLPVPLFIHILRVLWRNLLILAHNIIILPLALLLLGVGLSPFTLIAVPGLLLVALCLSWIALLLAIICTRYRDLPQIIASILQVAFYLTPIIWMPALLPERAGATFLNLNPFYHLIDLIRGPILGSAPETKSWLIVIAITLLGWALTLAIFARFRQRIAYWL